MDDKHRNLLRACTVHMVENIHMQTLWSPLRQYGVFSDTMLEEIMQGPNYRQVQKLCTELPRRGPHAFGNFLRSLDESEHDHVANYIRAEGERLGIIDEHTCPGGQPPQPNNSGQQSGQDETIPMAVENTEPPPENYRPTFSSMDPSSSLPSLANPSNRGQIHITPTAPPDSMRSQHLDMPDGSLESAGINLNLETPQNSIQPQGSGAGDSAQWSVRLDDRSLMRRLAERQDRVYPMTHNPSGYMLIINNETFADGRVRTGTQEDSNGLQDMFDKFGIRAEEKKNATAQDMEKHVSEFVCLDCHRDADCCVLVIMSHGREGDLVEGVDGEYVSIQRLLSYFNRATHLRDKPKLVIIQACRGDVYEIPPHPNSAHDAVGVNPENPGLRDAREMTLPPLNQSDMYIWYPAMPGYVSRRDPGGSWFIQTMIKVFEENGEYDDVQSMFNTVILKFREEFEGEDSVQNPIANGNLSKKWYLHQ